VLNVVFTQCHVKLVWSIVGRCRILYRERRPTIAYIASGFTRVGVTRGSNWRCHPIFFLEKTDDLFSHRPLQSDDLFSCRLVTTRTFRRRCLSSVPLSKFSQVFFISFGGHPLDGVTRGGPLPSSAATAYSLETRKVKVILTMPQDGVYLLRVLVNQDKTVIENSHLLYDGLLIQSNLINLICIFKIRQRKVSHKIT